MTALVKIATFAAALAAVFAASLGIGAAVGPTGDDPTREKGAHSVSHDAAPESTEMADPGPGGLPAGLMVSQDGYALQLATTAANPGRGRVIEFTIAGPDGAPFTKSDVAHDKRLHLIVIRRDFIGFQHVHPTMDSAGTWTVPVNLTPGSWRVFADFTPCGVEALTLGADLAVAGTYRPADTMPESRTALVDGYEVNLTGDLTAGADAKLILTVAKDGQPVIGLRPVPKRLRTSGGAPRGDLAFLHVHPDGTPGDGRTSPGPNVVFYAEVPSDGNCRLYLDFRHRGVVRTATFAVSASAPGTAPATPGSASPSPDNGHATH